MEGTSTNSFLTENGISGLLAALDEGGTGPLVEAIELGDLEQMQHWYLLLSKVSVDELLDAVEGNNLSVDDLYGIFRAVHLLMQWEHTQSNELKEIVEREIASAAEQEQKWETERETLQDELNTLREQKNTFSSSLNVNNLHEAFRAEIDALAEENLQLKRKSNELEKELNEQRERANNLDIKALGIERERALLANNQIQLEENIRELHRRMNTRSESIQRDQKWETSKLKQRDEQALILSEQVRELAAQNDELRAEADRLSQALEQATELVKENAFKFAEFDEQLSEAEHQLEKMGTDNKELRELIENKELEAKRKVDAAELDNRQLAEVLQSKDALIERLRNQIQNQKIEQFRLSTEILATEPDIHQKELELDNLRQELIAATETAKRLFGNEIAEDVEEENNNLVVTDNTNSELRIRLIQMDQELARSEKKYLEEQRHQVELEELLQQKELDAVRLMTDCQRYRKIAFGDRDLEMKKIERQLNFRDKQIQKLRKKCSELYLEVERLTEKRESFEKEKKIISEEDNKTIKEEEKKEVKLKEEEKEEILKEEQKEEEEEYVDEWMEDDEKEEEKEEEFVKIEVERPKQLKRKRLSKDKIIEEATTISALSTELGLLIEVKVFMYINKNIIGADLGK
ncbi:unnamed protein product [Meloidogyne enterolobii]|uniref:Uncharacterized protein n=1 Tax=Meloidogyne enterolobii TaxID=390850 RepID=A0ACB0ZMP8_MELEN